MYNEGAWFTLVIVALIARMRAIMSTTSTFTDPTFHDLIRRLALEALTDNAPSSIHVSLFSWA